MRQMKCPNNKGSTLVWALVIVFVLSILIGSALTLAFSYYNRSLINNDLRQAYFTARSVTDALRDEIKGDTENGQAILAGLNAVGDTVSIENINFSGDSTDQGYTAAYVMLEDADIIKITATTTIGERTKTVTLRLLKGSAYDNPVAEEFPGITVPDNVLVVSDSYPIDGHENTDIYAEADTTVIYLSNADFYGSIYTEAGVLISIDQGAKFHGSIYASSGTIFSFTKLHNQFTGTIFVRDGAVLRVNGRNYTITANGTSVSVSQSGMDSHFRSLLSIYTGTGGGGDTGWGDTVYE